MTFVPERWDVGLWDEAHWDGQLGLDAVAGSVTLSGKTVTFLVARKLAATTGSIALSGSTVAVASTKLLSALNGSIVFSGSTASLAVRRNYVATAVKAAILLAGQQASLQATLRSSLQALSGSVALTPQAANLRAAYRLTLAGGAIALTGKAANLAKAGLQQLVALPGLIQLSGQPVDLLTTALPEAIVLQAASGSILLTGRAASLDYLPGVGGDVVMVARSGAINVHAWDATLTRKSAFDPPPLYEPVSFASLMSHTVHLGIHGYRKIK